MRIAGGGTRWPRLLNPNHLVQILRRQKNPDTALRLFNAAPALYPSYRHNASAYSTILAILAYSGRHSAMRSVLHQMIHLDSCLCFDSLFARTIRYFADAARPDYAIALFRQIPQSNCVKWDRSFAGILRILVDCGRLDEAVRVFADGCNGGVKWEVEIFNILIEELCRRKRPELAIEVFGEIKENCCFPDRETYRILMRGLCEAGRLEDATHLLYSMLWRISQRGCDADVIVYRMLLEALCAEGRVKDAEEVLGKVLKKGLRVPRLRRSFQRWEITGESLEEKKNSINDALVRGGVRSAASYCAIIGDLYSEGKVKDADRLLDEMVNRGFSPNVSTYEAKICAACREGQAEDGVKVLEEEMARVGCAPALSTYNLVVQGLCREGKSVMADMVLKNMERKGGCIPRTETYETVIDGLCRELRYVEARQVMDRMLNKGHLPGCATYNQLIKGLSSLGRTYEAVLFLEEMISQGKYPEINVWNTLVSMACDVFWPPEANLLCQTLGQHGP